MFSHSGMVSEMITNTVGYDEPEKLSQLMPKVVLIARSKGYFESDGGASMVFKEVLDMDIICSIKPCVLYRIADAPYIHVQMLHLTIFHFQQNEIALYNAIRSIKANTYPAFCGAKQGDLNTVAFELITHPHASDIDIPLGKSTQGKDHCKK